MRITDNFDSREFACPCCGLDKVSTEMVELLQKARVAAGIPFKINSGVRCEKHNAEVGGVDSSAHVGGYACDISCVDSKRRYIILSALKSAGFTRLGIAKTFIHVDNDPTKPKSVTWVY